MVGLTGGGEDKVGQGGGVVEECQGRELGVMEKVSWWAERQFSAGDRCMADKVYLTPAPWEPGSMGRGGGPRTRWAQRAEKDLEDSEDFGGSKREEFRIPVSNSYIS